MVTPKPLTSPQPPQKLLYRTTIQTLCGRQSTFAGGEGAVVNVAHALPAVRIGVDGDEYAFFQGVGNPGPIQIEAVGARVEFDRYAVRGTGIDDAAMIDGVTGARQ